MDVLSLRRTARREARRSQGAPSCLSAMQNFSRFLARRDAGTQFVESPDRNNLCQGSKPSPQMGNRSAAHPGLKFRIWEALGPHYARLETDSNGTRAGHPGTTAERVEGRFTIRL